MEKLLVILTANIYHNTIVIYASYHLDIKFFCLMGRAKVADVAWFMGWGVLFSGFYQRRLVIVAELSWFMGGVGALPFTPAFLLSCQASFRKPTYQK